MTACDDEEMFEVSILLPACVRKSGRYSAMFNAMGKCSHTDIEGKVRDAGGKWEDSR